MSVQAETHCMLDEVRESCAYEEPRNEREQAIAQVWREAFRSEKIGCNDNYFELGGDSLLAMELTELLATRHAILVPVVVLFQYPTIRELAEVIDEIDRA